jgi:SAM-dependent methyltransferase
MFAKVPKNGSCYSPSGSVPTVAWTFVRPEDPAVLAGRPLLDLGTGDGQTVAALAPEGFVVGVDERVDLLRHGAVNALAGALPFGNASFETVLAADLFHHMDDPHLAAAIAEIARVLRPGGHLIAWWYEHTSDTSPDAPRFARPYDEVAVEVRAVDLTVEPLELKVAAPNSATVGLLATR